MLSTSKENVLRDNVDWTQPIPEVYGDVVWIAVSAWSAAVTFGVRGMREGENSRPLMRIRMPAVQAKALGLLLCKAVREHEQEQGIDLQLPPGVVDAIGLSDLWPRRALPTPAKGLVDEPAEEH